MPRPFKVPEVVDKLLSEVAYPWPRQPLVVGAELVKTRDRLKWLCAEMIRRIGGEVDNHRFGDIDRLIDESAMLAGALDYPNAPVSRVKWRRGEREKDPIVKRWFSPVYPAPRALTEPIIAPPGMIYERRGFTRVWGYRFFGPDGGLIEIHVAGLAHNDLPTGPVETDRWEGDDKRESRAVAIEILGRWVRELEAPAIPEPTNKDAIRGGPKGGNDHEPGVIVTADLKKLLIDKGIVDTEKGFRFWLDESGLKGHTREECKTLLGIDPPATRGNARFYLRPEALAEIANSEQARRRAPANSEKPSESDDPEEIRKRRAKVAREKAKKDLDAAAKKRGL